MAIFWVVGYTQQRFHYGYLTNPPGPRTPARNKGLIAGLIKGNQWLINPDHKALFLGGVCQGGRLTSHETKVSLCHLLQKKQGEACADFEKAVSWIMKKIVIFKPYPHTQCMVYLPTFG